MEAELYGGSQPAAVFRGWRASARLGGRRCGKRRVMTEGDDGRFVRTVGPHRIADTDSQIRRTAARMAHGGGRQVGVVLRLAQADRTLGV